MRIKKLLCVALGAIMVVGLTACGKTDNSKGGDNSYGGDKAFDTAKSISIISREDGSGTRGAFIELFGVEEKDSSGKKIDNTTEEATITNSTSVMMTSVASDVNAIGYISLGSLNDTVKAVKIDGAEPTVANIKSGTYKISRPFNIAAKSSLSEVAKDFVSYIMSSEGQKVIETSGYITVAENAAAYSGSKPSGKIVIAGSSSVNPVMEKLKEAYLKINTNAQIEIQESDSTTGVTSTVDGICDIGMVSRDLKDSEKEKGISETTIALDGIAVIVNKSNTANELTSAQVKDMFTGKSTKWSDIIK